MAGLGMYPAGAVLRAENLERARGFYADVLGLKERPAGPGALAFEAGQGTMVMVYERPGMAAPENTALGFGVPAGEFDALVDELRSRGVVFEDYDIPEMGLKTENGVATMDGSKAAWFKDTEGNILNVGTM